MSPRVDCTNWLCCSLLNKSDEDKRSARNFWLGFSPKKNKSKKSHYPEMLVMTGALFLEISTEVEAEGKA